MICLYPSYKDKKSQFWIRNEMDGKNSFETKTGTLK